ncbi:MAG: sugar transferase [Symploca sp. SIO1C2]|nr:sugar transferase [Symploca sp. SIO1C2]
MQDTPITISKILLKTSKISTIEIGSSGEQPVNPLAHCTLKWRYKRLWVSYTQQPQEPYLPSLDNEEWLVDCLKHSPVRVVCIEANLGGARLRLLADACEQAQKHIFLRIPPNRELFSKQQPILWWLQRVIEWNIAALLLLVLSPVILGLILLIRIFSAESVFSEQWRVGQRGKLFRVLRFRTMTVDAETRQQYRGKDQYSFTFLGRWLHRYHLDGIPQLVNVLRGEMKLFGSRACKLDEVALFSKSELRDLRMLPGVIGVFQETRKNPPLTPPRRGTGGSKV